ncbi:hypothetical protein [Streptomyces sp. NPDC054797]
MAAETEGLAECGWLTRDAEDWLWLTEEGEQARVDLARSARLPAPRRSAPPSTRESTTRTTWPR